LSSVCSVSPSYLHAQVRLPRILHSFPTRRSSDLGVLICRMEGRLDGTTSPEADTHLTASAAKPEGARMVLDCGPMSHLSSAGLRDRKSTRLNSSHVKISYAVFCLKKKKV